jgi:hypothetical protein
MSTISSRREAIVQRMRAIQRRISSDYQQAREQVTQVTDWRFYVSQFPWVTLGGLALAAYSMVPAARQAPARIPPQSAPQPAPAPKHPLSFETISNVLTTVALRAASSWAINTFSRFMSGLVEPRHTANDRQSFTQVRDVSATHGGYRHD